MRIRKRVSIIDGYQVKKEWFEDESTIPDQLIKNDDITISNEDGYIIIDTLEGFIKVGVGDWIIKEIDGQFHSIDGKIFDQLYESTERRFI